MIIKKVLNDYYENAGYDLGYIDGMRKALDKNEVVYHLQGIWTNKKGNEVYTFKCWPEDDGITDINIELYDEGDGTKALEGITAKVR